MVERTGGAGGFGGITSDRMDQRQGRYHPHLNVTVHEQYAKDETQVVCFNCGQRWFHRRGDARGSAPGECSGAEDVHET